LIPVLHFICLLLQREVFRIAGTLPKMFSMYQKDIFRYRSAGTGECRRSYCDYKDIVPTEREIYRHALDAEHEFQQLTAVFHWHHFEF
jgi:hypothetical protein